MIDTIRDTIIDNCRHCGCEAGLYRTPNGKYYCQCKVCHIMTLPKYDRSIDAIQVWNGKPEKKGKGT